MPSMPGVMFAAVSTDTGQREDAWRKALNALCVPLRYAAQHDFIHLDRIKDLEKTLLQAAQRALSLASQPEQQGLLQQLIKHIPTAQLPRPERVAALQKVAAICDQLAAIANTVPQQPPAKVVATPPALPTSLELLAHVQALRGVGPKIAAALQARGLTSIESLLRFLPRRYCAHNAFDALGDLQPGVIATAQAEVYSVSQLFVRGRKRLDVVVGDTTGRVHLVWFRVPHKQFAEQFVRGRALRISGQVKRYKQALQIVHPDITWVDNDSEQTLTTDSVVPMYLEVDGVPVKQLRRIIAQALPLAQKLVDPLPKALLQAHQLPSLATALTCLHQPPPQTSLAALERMQTPWQQRLIYEELLVLQLGVLRQQKNHAQVLSKAVRLTEGLAQTARSVLPFAPTTAQQRVLQEIEADLRCNTPMHRLLQGDVGSGKTAVALTLAVAMARAGLQTAFMVPTELLAEQHAQVATKLLEPLGIRVGLLTGHMGAALKRQAYADLQQGVIQLAIGTHALIQNNIAFAALALSIVDEQHRFGVLQRARLKELGEASWGVTPHMLVMTATPIPRTLALTVYGDLHVSIIDGMPPGRKPIKTRLYKSSQSHEVYEVVRQAVQRGRQAYVVFPLVEMSDKEGMQDLRDATQGVEELAAGPLQGLRLGLLHGKLPSAAKATIMQAFARHEIDVLVATTVIEVGIDVPNATVMVIEHAERFGLSQLHQLRGRVGRGAHESECLLLSHRRGHEDAWRRLAVMEQTNDGFRIAEEDLAMRGPGDFVGTRQAGLPMLSFANLARDQKILLQARQDATILLEEDPTLAKLQHQDLARLVSHGWDNGLHLLQVG